MVGVKLGCVTGSFNKLYKVKNISLFLRRGKWASMGLNIHGYTSVTGWNIN